MYNPVELLQVPSLYILTGFPLAVIMSTNIKFGLLLSHSYDSFHNLHLPYGE